jgi:hypothetical protein
MQAEAGTGKGASLDITVADDRTHIAKQSTRASAPAGNISPPLAVTGPQEECNESSQIPSGGAVGGRGAGSGAARGTGGAATAVPVGTAEVTGNRAAGVCSRSAVDDTGKGSGSGLGKKRARALNDLPAADINARARASLPKRTATVQRQTHAPGKRNKQQAVTGTDTISAEIAHRQQERKQACAAAKLLEDSDSDLDASQ